MVLEGICVFVYDLFVFCVCSFVCGDVGWGCQAVWWLCFVHVLSLSLVGQSCKVVEVVIME